MRDHIREAAAVIASAQRVFVITGAGMSADSGLPTYRGIGGLYDDAVTDEGVAIEEALSGQMLARDPTLTWKYVAQIEAACRGAQANAGHRALAALESDNRKLCVLTQNVDGFHNDAGSTDVIEMHGNIHRLRCTQCRQAITVADFSRLSTMPPVCARCGGMMRPGTVLFGEMLPTAEVAHYEQAMDDGFDAVLVIGTTAVFPYIAAPVHHAARCGIPAIEINPSTSDVSAYCDIQIRERAAQALSRISETVLAESVCGV